MAKHRSKIDHKEYVERKLKSSKKFRETYEKTTMSVDLAVLIAEMRKAAGYTQAELAEMIGTTQSVIARLESAEYEGHSLPMLRKVALACTVKLELTARKPKKRFKRDLVLA